MQPSTGSFSECTGHVRTGLPRLIHVTFAILHGPEKLSLHVASLTFGILTLDAPCGHSPPKSAMSQGHCKE